MRLLTRDDVKKAQTIRENRDTARLHLISEELSRKENILNTVIDGVDTDKENILKDFEAFKQEFIGKKSRLNSQIGDLEQRKGVLEVETIREKATTLALDELEDTFLNKKRRVEESLAERKGELSQKEKALLQGLNEYTYQLEQVNERAVSMDERERNLADRKQEVKEESESLEEREKSLEFKNIQNKEELVDRELRIETGKASNQVVKEQLNEEWKGLGKEKVEFTQEKNSIRDSLAQTKERDRQLESQEKYNEKIKTNIEDEWKKMERERLSLKEKQDTFKGVEDKLHREVKDFQATKASVRIDKQNVEGGWRDIKKANIKLKDERAVLDSAWRELDKR